ncbi:GNAT family N-acetyltransferase [Agromyces sp. Marseille-P2726]|uniref:GNAT family N-acetyltransferase n=1 Tax=Agromyces sp. Marseille-P2726 TaxID=2709132 RepID=UPI001C2D49B5|nr:GNAT family N-acetyltransferase [Agromyces sp. Marseille-P2726]
MDFTVRPARIEDAAAMAKMHMQSWRETYRGLMPDRVLDDPGLVAARERFWVSILTDDRFRANRTALAERDRAVIGVAMAGPADDGAEPDGVAHLYVLYVVAAEHGSGAGAALLNAVLPPEQPATLWVADPNPRAQAFYRKHGFVADGTEQVDDGVREIRMVRRAQ